jgi:hypothetical protein
VGGRNRLPPDPPPRSSPRPICAQTSYWNPAGAKYREIPIRYWRGVCKGSVINGLYKIQDFAITIHMNGSDKRRWFRSAPRGLVPRLGKLLLGPKTVPVDCHIVDLSAGGACLELSKTYEFPSRFEFLHGSTRRFCTLAWSRGFRIGISYEGTIQRSSVSGGLSRPKSGASMLSRNR